MAVNSQDPNLQAWASSVQAAISAGEIGIWTAMVGGQCIADPYVLKLFGLQPRESGMVTLAELMGAVHPDDLKRALDENKTAVETGRPYESEFRTVMPDGSSKWVAVRGQVSRLDDGGANLAGIVMDITPRKTAQIREQEANRRITEFLATLAHELRNPLAPLRNCLAVLNTFALPEGADKAREIMGRQLGLMSHLIDDLMDVARISSGKVNLIMDRTDVRDAIRNAIETSDPQIVEGRHRLSIGLPENPVYVNGDRLRLAQVFSNLLTNASRYTAAGGNIAISVAEENGSAVVRVADNGIGIDADKLAEVFEMFSQVAPPLERKAGGLGIGLSLARSLVALHGGSIHAESEGAGKGSTFVVRLPLAP